MKSSIQQFNYMNTDRINMKWTNILLEKEYISVIINPITDFRTKYRYDLDFCCKIYVCYKFIPKQSSHLWKQVVRYNEIRMKIIRFCDRLLDLTNGRRDRRSLICLYWSSTSYQLICQAICIVYIAWQISGI